MESYTPIRHIYRSAMENNIDFENLAGSEKFAEFTELLMKLTGLVMALNSPGGDVRGTSSAIRGGNPFCRLIRGTSEGLRRCTDCDRRHHEKSVMKNKPLLYACHAGFLDMAVPVFVQGRHVATISSGQLLPNPPNELEFKKFISRISWLESAESSLRKAYFSAPFLPREKVMYVMRLLELFAGHLCDSIQRIRELESEKERKEIRLAKEFVEKHFNDPAMGLADVAKYAGLSPAHFSHVFKQRSGMPFVRFVQERRVREAKRLMMRADKSITEICFSCGFNSLTNFNRVFRSFERQCPRYFRKELMKGNA